MRCELHPHEQIKYYCREDGKSCCPECVVDHAKHDFIFADASAAFEVRQELKTLELTVQSRSDEYDMIMRESLKKIEEVETFREQEMINLRHFFSELHKALEAREAQINQTYEDYCKEFKVEYQTDIAKIGKIQEQMAKILKSVDVMFKGFEKANDIAVVGSVEKVKEIGRNYAVFQSRLQKMYPSTSFTIRQKDESPKIPTFTFNMSHAKRYIDSLGAVNYDFSIFNPQLFEEGRMKNGGVYSTHKNQIIKRAAGEGPEPEDMLPPLLAEANGTKKDYQASVGPILSQHVTVDNVYWPKWDSNEIYRYDFPKKEWVLHYQKTPTKFLFFSSVCHLPLVRNPSSQSVWGMYILGGSDAQDNFSKRVQLFGEYRVFIEKAPMINKRAFFPSVVMSFQEDKDAGADTLFVFGGHDGEYDLETCEQYSIRENVWRSIAPMNMKRNGASVVSFDKIIFVFGGNNQANGSLDSIERYSIEFDKWTVISLKLREPVHDTIAFPVGGRRVLIFGGSLGDGNPNTYWQIYDLTSECLIEDSDKVKFEGGKIYLPPVFDPDVNKLHFFQGYGDTPLTHEDIATTHMICRCNPGMTSNGYRVHEVPGYINVSQVVGNGSQMMPMPLPSANARMLHQENMLEESMGQSFKYRQQLQYQQQQEQASLTERNSLLNQSAVIINAGIGGGIATGPPRHQNTNNSREQRESFVIGSGGGRQVNSSVGGMDRNMFPVNVFTPDKYVKKAYL